MTHIIKAAFACFLFGAVAAGAADTNYAVRLDCELQTAGPASLKDVNWTQGQTPLMELRVLRNGRPVVADTNTSVRMLFAASPTAATYAVATNYWPSTNAASYFVQWGAIGTNTAGTGTTASAWYYTVYFDKISTGETYWSGNGALYIEKSTSLADGLNWIAATNLPRVSWANVLGDPASNASLAEYLAATAGEDAIARAAASNAQAVASNALSKTLNWNVWPDAATNYYARAADGSDSTNSTSFSAVMNHILSGASANGVVIDLANTTLPGGQIVFYYVDAPIMISGTVCVHIRGGGGPHIAVAPGYTNALIRIGSSSNKMAGQTRFVGLNFVGGPAGSCTTQNTNAFLAFDNANDVEVSGCYFSGLKGSAVSVGSALTDGEYNVAIRDNWFYSARYIHPMIRMSAPGGAAIWGASISRNYFNALSNAPCIEVESGDVRYVSVADNIFNKFGHYYGTGVVFRSGYGHSVAGNSFISFVVSARPITFDSPASNSFWSVVAGNSFGSSYPTNGIVIGADSHGVIVQGNSLGTYAGGARIIQSGDNTGGFVLQGFGTNSTTAARGDDARLSNARTPTAHNQGWSTITGTPNTVSGYGITDALTSESDPEWDTWRTDAPPGTTNAILPDGSLVDISAILGGGAGGVDAAEAGQIATNVAAGYLPLAGGALSGNINMGGNGITNVGKIVGTDDLVIEAGGTLEVHGSMTLGGVTRTNWPSGAPGGSGATQLVINAAGEAAVTSTWDAASATITVADLPVPEGGGGAATNSIAPVSGGNVSGTWTVDFRSGPVQSYTQTGAITAQTYVVHSTNEAAYCEVILLADTNSITWISATGTTNTVWVNGLTPTHTVSTRNVFALRAHRGRVHATQIGTTP